MTATDKPTAAEKAADKRDRAAIKADIQRQRAELASTVSALSERLDVKTRATRRMSAIADDVKATTKQRPEVLAGAIAALVAVLVIVRKLRRR